MQLFNPYSSVSAEKKNKASYLLLRLSHLSLPVYSFFFGYNISTPSSRERPSSGSVSVECSVCIYPTREWRHGSTHYVRISQCGSRIVHWHDAPQIPLSTGGKEIGRKRRRRLRYGKRGMNPLTENHRDWVSHIFCREGDKNQTLINEANGWTSKMVGRTRKDAKHPPISVKKKRRQSNNNSTENEEKVQRDKKVTEMW